ncbi:cysteine-rich secretory protein 2-like [Rhynchocyon petersi]
MGILSNTYAMIVLPRVLFLAAVLLPSIPANEEIPDFDVLSTTLIHVQEEIVNKHNSLRRSVSPPASDMLKMSWDKAAAINSQKWANQCIYSHSSKEARKTNTSCGENLFMSSDLPSWSEAIQSWYDEVYDFTFGKGAKSTDAVIGHYTQVVWSTSYRVGCGVAYCPEEELPYYLVCQYCPAGNYVSRKNYPYKEGPPCGSCPNDCEDGLCTENDKEVTQLFPFIPANSCSYEDDFSNCKDMKKQATCDHELVKTKCKAACFCEGKIY